MNNLCDINNNDDYKNIMTRGLKRTYFDEEDNNELRKRTNLSKVINKTYCGEKVNVIYEVDGVKLDNPTIVNKFKTYFYEKEYEKLKCLSNICKYVLSNNISMNDRRDMYYEAIIMRDLRGIEVLNSVFEKEMGITIKDVEKFNYEEIRFGVLSGCLGYFEEEISCDKIISDFEKMEIILIPFNIERIIKEFNDNFKVIKFYWENMTSITKKKVVNSILTVDKVIELRILFTMLKNNKELYDNIINNITMMKIMSLITKETEFFLKDLLEKAINAKNDNDLCEFCVKIFNIMIYQF
jgi:hypothetical protein